MLYSREHFMTSADLNLSVNFAYVKYLFVDVNIMGTEAIHPTI